MSTSKKLATAALAGFLSAGIVGAGVAHAADGAMEKSATAGATMEKHACKGQNSCKGNGGCKAGDNGCKGKNSCKGKGGCATDGSKPAK
ncbi:MAG: hypothetical protein U1E36_00320 [Rickettsiales bacterium]